jgi:hypothetical protein
MVTDHGLVVADKTDPSAEQQVRAALAQAGLRDVRLMDSLAGASDNKQQVNAQAGGLAIIHNDPKFGAQNPQGFRGGGFALGGAEVNVTGKRCEPACSTPSGGSQAPGVSFAPPTPAQAQAAAEPAAGAPPSAAPASAVELTTAAPAGVVAPEFTVTFTSDATPKDAAPSAAPASPAQPSPAQPVPEQVFMPARQAAARPARALFAALNAMDGRDGDELHRLFLAVAGAVAVLLAARLLSSPLIRRRNRP